MISPILSVIGELPKLFGTLAVTQNAPFVVEGYWDLGSYWLNLDKSSQALATASVTFIKRTGTFPAKIVWHDIPSSYSGEKLYNLLTASPPALEIFVEHTYLLFTLHVYPQG